MQICVKIKFPKENVVTKIYLIGGWVVMFNCHYWSCGDACEHNFLKMFSKIIHTWRFFEWQDTCQNYDSDRPKQQQQQQQQHPEQSRTTGQYHDKFHHQNQTKQIIIAFPDTQPNISIKWLASFLLDSWLALIDWWVDGSVGVCVCVLTLCDVPVPQKLTASIR